MRTAACAWRDSVVMLRTRCRPPRSRRRAGANAEFRSASACKRGTRLAIEGTQDTRSARQSALCRALRLRVAGRRGSAHLESRGLRLRPVRWLLRVVSRQRLRYELACSRDPGGLRSPSRPNRFLRCRVSLGAMNRDVCSDRHRGCSGKLSPREIEDRTSACYSIGARAFSHSSF